MACGQWFVNPWPRTQPGETIAYNDEIKRQKIKIKNLLYSLTHKRVKPGAVGDLVANINIMIAFNLIKFY